MDATSIRVAATDATSITIVATGIWNVATTAILIGASSLPDNTVRARAAMAGTAATVVGMAVGAAGDGAVRALTCRSAMADGVDPATAMATGIQASIPTRPAMPEWLMAAAAAPVAAAVPAGSGNLNDVN